MRPFIDEFLDKSISYGKKVAISFYRDGNLETDISYEKLVADSNRMVNVFTEIGIKRRDRIIFFLEKSLFFIIAHLAAQKIGAIGVPLNTGFTKSEMTYFLKDTNPKLVITGLEQEPIITAIDPTLPKIVINTKEQYQDLGVLQSAGRKVRPLDSSLSDIGLIIYTSGTTGDPKGAILTQSNLAHDAKKIIEAWQISGSDVLLHALPLFHAHGLCFALHTCLLAGARILMLDHFKAEHALTMFSDPLTPYPCTLFMGVPTMYTRLLDHIGKNKLNFEHVRLWTCGSAPLLPKDFERITKTFGKEPVEREGMTETGMNFSNPISGLRKPGSIGLSLPGLEVAIVDPSTFKTVEPGKEGEIWLKGPGISTGYWEKPKATREVFQQGWFRTGDLGKVDADGYYYLTDRIKHIIISGGENISPKEVEGVINQLTDVVESSVVGVPDVDWGEKVSAAVVKKPNSDLTANEILKHCKQHLHKWKCPKEIRFISELPKNTMGKVLKQQVRKLFL